MTIDKTMELVEGVVAYNFLVDLESQPEIEYVTVGQLGRAAAILMTIGLTVKLWGFDLEAYFRKTGKQRSHWWMSGFVHADGYGYDHLGRPVMVLEEGVLRHQCRAELHYLAAIGMCQTFGHSDAVDKGAPPCYSMVFLGISISLPGRSLTLSKEKEKEYSKLLLSIVNGEDGVLHLREQRGQTLEATGHA
jgi:hypothetical protein